MVNFKTRPLYHQGKSPCRDSNPHHPARSPALYHWAIPIPMLMSIHNLFGLGSFRCKVTILVFSIDVFMLSVTLMSEVRANVTRFVELLPSTYRCVCSNHTAASHHLDPKLRVTLSNLGLRSGQLSQESD
jgi:hypothetical protein